MIKIENISKVLIIIGSIIISIIIISLLIYAFAGISELGKNKQDTEYVLKMQEYNRKFESFNRDNLYGVDIISLANLVEDYNSRNDYEDTEIEMIVIISTGVDDAKFFKMGNYGADDIVSFVSKLSSENSDELHDFKLKKFKCSNIQYSGTKIIRIQMKDEG